MAGWWLVALIILNTKPAYAYLDPGSGSYLIQMIIAGTIAVGATMTVTRERLVSMIRKILKKDKDEKKG